MRDLLESHRAQARAGGGFTGVQVDYGLPPSLALRTLLGG